MLKISEFAKLSQVSIKTLHYYDEIGLLTPAEIDPQNGYRYYTVEQLPRIHRIMALKDMGLSLEQIGLMLNDALESAEIRAMLKLKKNEVEQQVREESQRLARIEFHLRMLEAEQDFPEMEAAMKQLEPFRALSLFVEPHHNIYTMVEAIQKGIANGDIQHKGKLFDVFHGQTFIPFESPDLEPQQHEILIEVEDSQQDVFIEEVGQWTVKEQQAIPLAATLMLKGNQKTTSHEKIVLLHRWAIKNNLQPLGQVRNQHHRGFLDTLDRNEMVFEAQIPVAEMDS